MSGKSVLFYHTETAGYQPLVDLYETDDHLVFEIELPGVDPKEVLIKVYDDLVILEGVKREWRDERRVRYLCMERKFVSFRRILKIPVPVNSMAGEAAYREGVITLKFPRLKDKVIRIKIGT